MLIYMIRHGQTDWNAEGRMQGQKDIDLNVLGRSQARGNGEALGKILGAGVERFSFIASPLRRTRETMEHVRAAMGLDPQDYQLDDRLKEVSFGDWEGHTLAELAVLSPERCQERHHNKWDFIPPGTDAESYEIMSWRIGAWLNDVKGPTVCVSHGGVIRACFRLVGGVDKTRACDIDIPQDRILRIDRDKGDIGWL